MTYYGKTRASISWPLQSDSNFCLQQSSGVVTYPDMLPDDNNTIDAFQLRSMLPETIPPDSTSSNMVLDPEDMFPDELPRSPENVKFPDYISGFGEAVVSSALPLSVSHPPSTISSVVTLMCIGAQK